MDRSVWLAKRNYWIAGIGAIVSVVSFFAFPFLNIVYSFSLPNFGSGTSSTTPINLPPLSAMDVASHQGLLWVSLLLVLVVLAGAIVFLVRRNPFGSRVPLQMQARWMGLGFVITGVVSALCLAAAFLWMLQNVQSLTQSIMESQIGGLGANFVNLFRSSFSATLGFGTYLFLAGLAMIVVAGVLELISPAQLPDEMNMAAAPTLYPQSAYNYPYGDPPASGGQPYPPPGGPYQR